MLDRNNPTTEDLSKAVVASVQRVASALRADNERLKRRVDLLATRSTSTDLLEARIKRLEARPEDDPGATLAVLWIATPKFCAAVGLECGGEFLLVGHDEYGNPVKTPCKSAADVVEELRVYWPARLAIMAATNNDPGLKLLMFTT